MGVQLNGTGVAPTAGLVATQPLTVAGAFLIAVQTVSAALFAVLDDAGVAPWLTLSTQALITAAVMSIAVFIVLAWAARHTTPRAAPVLPESTVVGLTNGSGKVAAVATLPTVADAQGAPNVGGSDNG